jgi:uncharacterized membrane protein YeaQ/YmgE (transglycosylase-associated protein family)
VFWIWVVLVGLVIGFVARFLLPGRDPVGFIGTLAVGVAGALIGTWLWEQVLFKDNDNDGVAVIAGIVVAMILLGILRMVMGRRGTTIT